MDAWRKIRGSELYTHDAAIVYSSLARIAQHNPQHRFSS